MSCATFRDWECGAPSTGNAKFEAHANTGEEVSSKLTTTPASFSDVLTAFKKSLTAVKICTADVEVVISIHHSNQSKELIGFVKDEVYVNKCKSKLGVDKLYPYLQCFAIELGKGKKYRGLSFDVIIRTVERARVENPRVKKPIDIKLSTHLTASADGQVQLPNARDETQLQEFLSHINIQTPEGQEECADFFAIPMLMDRSSKYWKLLNCISNLSHQVHTILKGSVGGALAVRKHKCKDGRTRTVHVGKRGGEYVRIKGNMVYTRRA